MPTTPRALKPSSRADMEAVADAVRGEVRRIAPQLHSETKWRMPWLAGKDLVLFGGPFTRQVGVEFWRGSSLPDPHCLLEGTGKNLRHVKLRTIAEARAPEFASLIW